jgi:hypothetical protein
MRLAFLLALAALPQQAGAQTSDASAATRLRDPVFYRGECVRTTGVRNDRDDACPRVHDYRGWTRDQVTREQEARVYGHYPLPLKPGKDEATGERVTDQWPDPDRPAGWPRSYPVVLMFGKTAVTVPPPPYIPDRKDQEVTPKPPPICPTCPSLPVLRGVPPLVGQLESEAGSRAAKEGFAARKLKPDPQEAGRVLYQSPRAGTQAAPGSVIDYVLAVPPPPSPPSTTTPGPVIKIPVLVPEPYEVEGPTRVVALGAGAAGAGAAGGYMLARLLRRRSQEEEEEIEAATQAAVILRARVHVDRRGEQQVEML